MSNIYIKTGWVVAILLLSLSLVHSQKKEQFKFDHRAVYEVSYLSDSLDQGSQKQEMTELLIGEGKSLFRSLGKAYEDSLYNTQVITLSEPQVFFIGDINAFNYQILKEFPSGRTKVYDEYTGSNLNNLKEVGYYFEPEESMSTWTLKEDTSTIAGHLCQRADVEFGGRKWTAWFSPEISEYSDGPYKFRGLPGLILRVHDEKKTWDFKLVELAKIDTLIHINFKEDLSFVETTKEDLYRDRRDFQKNQIEIKEAAGANFGDSRKSVKKQLEEYILKDNNWIELYQ